MADVGEAPDKAFGLVTKHVGPLPLWAWAVAAGGALLALRLVRAGKPAPVTIASGRASTPPPLAPSSGGGSSSPGGPRPEPPAVRPREPAAVVAPPAAATGAEAPDWWQQFLVSLMPHNMEKFPRLIQDQPSGGGVAPVPQPTVGQRPVVPAAPTRPVTVTAGGGPVFAGAPHTDVGAAPGQFVRDVFGIPIGFNAHGDAPIAGNITRAVSAVTPPNGSPTAGAAVAPSGPTVQGSGLGSAPLPTDPRALAEMFPGVVNGIQASLAERTAQFAAVQAQREQRDNPQEDRAA